MPQYNAEILTEEKIAISKYIDERDAMSNDMRLHMNKTTYKKNFKAGLFGGAAVGFVMGLLLAPTNSQTPIRDKNGHVTEYKMDSKKLANSTLSIIAITTLAVLSIAGVQTVADTTINRRWADKLSHDTLKKCFTKSFSDYNTKENPIQIIRATALILNNLPETELERLRALAVHGMVQDVDGFYSVRPEQIATAAQIISNFIRYNPEINDNVSNIMNGGEPKTYFLSTLVQQKTR